MANDNNYGFNLDDVHTTNKYAVGEKFQYPLGVVYEYIKFQAGSGSTTCRAGHILHPYAPIASVSTWAIGNYTPDYTDTRICFTDKIAVSMCNFSTDATYGLVQVAGRATARLASTFVFKLGDYVGTVGTDKQFRRWQPNTFGCFGQIVTADTSISSSTSKCTILIDRKMEAEF
jgi:hypothetical protein